MRYLSHHRQRVGTKANSEEPTQDPGVGTRASSGTANTPVTMQSGTFFTIAISGIVVAFHGENDRHNVLGQTNKYSLLGFSDNTRCSTPVCPMVSMSIASSECKIQLAVIRVGVATASEGRSHVAHVNCKEWACPARFSPSRGKLANRGAPALVEVLRFPTHRAPPQQELRGRRNKELFFVPQQNGRSEEYLFYCVPAKGRTENMFFQ